MGAGGATHHGRVEDSVHEQHAGLLVKLVLDLGPAGDLNHAVDDRGSLCGWGGEWGGGREGERGGGGGESECALHW
jgi:hypothetical protein